MWVRAVWQEGKKQHEGVVPDVWIQNNNVRWPSGLNVIKPHAERQTPCADWKTFPLIKIKCTADSRYGCFFSEEPILDYDDLLENVKSAVPYIRNIPTDRIRIAYKDVRLSSSGQGEGVFINIFPGNQMVLEEAFRNAYDCGAESFKRIEIKLREVDSPCIAKMRLQNTTSTSTINAKRSTPDLGRATEQQTAGTSKELFPEQDWKTSKLGTMSDQTQQLQDELLAVNVQLDDLQRPIIEPAQIGQYKSIVCGKCHIRGHRSDGNRHNAACKRELCTSFYNCGQKKKHPEHFEQIRNLTKRQKRLHSEIDTLKTDRQSLEAFKSKSVSTFVTAMTPRLLKAFPDRYNKKTTSGTISLQKDLATLRVACNNKIPEHSIDEREYFIELLEKQQKQFSEFDTFDDRASTSKPNIYINTHISSPVKKRMKKPKHHKNITEMLSSDDYTDSSDTTSESSDSSSEEMRSKSRRSKKYRCKYKSRSKSKGSKKKSYNRVPVASVRTECVSNENIEIRNNVHEIQTINQTGVSPYLRYLQGAVPSDSGLFEATNSSQQTQLVNKDRRPEPEDMSRHQNVVGHSTLTLTDLANAADGMGKLTGL